MAGHNAESGGKGALYGEAYLDHFDAEEYLQDFFGVESPRSKCGMKILKDVHLLLEKATHHGDVLIEMCSGPCVSGIISASKYYKKIYLTDYASSCNVALRKWVSKDSTAFDMTHYFQAVAEFEGSGITASDIERRVRESIQGVFQCNLAAEEPLGPEQNNLPKADAIVSLKTVDVVATDDNSYVKCLRKLYNQLAPGGLLCFLGDSRSGQYNVGNTMFVTFGNTQNSLRSSFQKAGFIDVDFKEMQKDIYDFHLVSAKRPL